MDVRVLTNPEGADECAEEWEDLVQVIDHRLRAFADPRYLLAWWKCFKRPADQLHIVVLRDNEGLKAVAPWFISPRFMGGPGTCIRFLGEGTSDYLDVVVSPQHRASATRILASHLASLQNVDCAYFTSVPEEAAVRDVLFALSGYEVSETRQAPCPVLSRGFELPTALKAEIRYYERRAARQGTLSFHVARTDAEIQTGVEVLFTLHRKRWGRTPTPSKFDSPRVRDYYKSLALKLCPAGLAELSILRLNAVPIAVHFGFVTPRAYQYWTPAFDPDFKTLSPGLLLTNALVERCWATGRWEFDFLRGDEPYKLKWADQVRWVYRVTAYRRTARGRVIRLLYEAVRPRLKSIKRRLLS